MVLTKRRMKKRKKISRVIEYLKERGYTFHISKSTRNGVVTYQNIVDMVGDDFVSNILTPSKKLRDEKMGKA